MKKKVQFGLVLLLALVVLALVLAGLPMMPTYEPAKIEASFPTPQCCAFGGGDWSMVTYMNATEIATTTRTCSTGQQTAAYVLADVQTIVTMPTSNTVSCYYEFSNDNSTWCTETTTINHKVAANTVACDEFNLFGRYSRICCQTLYGTDMITVTQRAKVFN